MPCLPLERLTTDQAIAAYWVLGQLIATPVAQKWDGTMIYDVTDAGRRYGYGVRGSWTNVELSFHTDNAFAVAPPDFVGLLCLMPAREGGISRFCSLYTVHNEMLRRYPRQLERLYQPCYYDRQVEHAPGDPKVSWVPCFTYDAGRLRARFSPSPIRKGYALMQTARRRGRRRVRCARGRREGYADLDGIHDPARSAAVPEQLGVRPLSERVQGRRDPQAAPGPSLVPQPRPPRPIARSRAERDGWRVEHER